MYGPGGGGRGFAGNGHGGGKERQFTARGQMAGANQRPPLADLPPQWQPHENAKATENAYLTLFIGRLSYGTNDKKLRREFEDYGEIRSVKIVTDEEGKHRGYAFVEFEKEEDMSIAYKRADGKKIDGKRIIVDWNARTVRQWRPRRLGGGLVGRKDTPLKLSPAVPPVVPGPMLTTPMLVGTPVESPILPSGWSIS